MIGFIKHLFESNIKSKSQTRLFLFKRFALYTDLIVKIGCIMYFGAVLMFLPYPMYMYIFEGEKELMMPAYIPGINRHTPNGYFISMLLQATLLFLGCVGMCSCDVFYALTLSNIPIMARIIEDEVHQLNEMLEINSNKDWTHQFYTILMMHQKMTTYVIVCLQWKIFNLELLIMIIPFYRYIRDYNKIFFKICFVQIASCMSAAISTSYLIITVKCNRILILCIGIHFK